jgi:SRSO17 transposase
LDEYELRKWDAWHRHITLSLLAHAYLAVLRSNAANGDKTGGKKGMTAPICFH